jgi:hypothetical protein
VEVEQLQTRREVENSGNCRIKLISQGNEMDYDQIDLLFGHLFLSRISGIMCFLKRKDSLFLGKV